MLTQYDSFEIRCCSKDRLIGDLPENVLGLGAAAQGNNGAITHRENSRYLEEPNIVCTARNSDATGGYQDSIAPFVKTGVSVCPVISPAYSSVKSGMGRPAASV